MAQAIDEKRKCRRDEACRTIRAALKIIGRRMRPLPFRISGHPYPPGTVEIAEQQQCLRIAQAVLFAADARAVGEVEAAEREEQRAARCLRATPQYIENVTFHTASAETWESYMQDFNYHHPHISSQ